MKRAVLLNAVIATEILDLIPRVRLAPFAILPPINMAESENTPAIFVIFIQSASSDLANSSLSLNGK